MLNPPAAPGGLPTLTDAGKVVHLNGAIDPILP
jgi:hypothetical protein